MNSAVQYVAALIVELRAAVVMKSHAFAKVVAGTAEHLSECTCGHP